MHAVHLNLNLINKELETFYAGSNDLEHFRKESSCHLIKLRKIPEPIIDLLENRASVYGLVFLQSLKENKKNSSNDALVWGNANSIYKYCSYFEQKVGEPALVGQKIRRVMENYYKKKPGKLVLGRTIFPLGRKTLIMGILNVTPDSFSDGGLFNNLDSALAQAYRMAEEGADIIDIGGESTRPGCNQISTEEELKRVMPVITALKKDQNFKVPLSIDTYKASVAEVALEAGVEMLNDVWGLRADKALGPVAARFKVPICLMHNRASNIYEDLIPDIIAEINESIDLALQAGIEDNQIIVDPGIGFGKDVQQNLDVMLHLSDFCSLGYPLLLGTSRKSMIGKTLDLPVEERLEGTAATVTYGISAGADLIRVHDITEMKRVALMTDAMVRR